MNILGVGVSAINMEMALQHIESIIVRGEKGYICVTGVHGVMESQRDPDLRVILNRATLCTPDGMPLVWLGKYVGKFQQMDRVYGPDLMLAVCGHSETTGFRHFFYGGADGVAQDLAEALRARFPKLNVVGTYTPPFRPLNQEEERDLRGLVKRTKPDIFWVGLSTPKQERFMAEFIHKLDTRVMIGVGAAFDFHSGRVRQAPRWIQRSGLEWLYRLSQEPKRLWRRYLYNNPAFIYKVVCQLLGLTHYDIPKS